MKKLLTMLLLAGVACHAQGTLLLMGAGGSGGGGTPTLTCLPNAASGNSSGTTSVTATYGTNNTAGNLLVATTSDNNLTSDVYTDSTSSTWARAQASADPSDQSTNTRSTMGFSLSAVGGANTVTNTQGVVSFAEMSIMECHRTSGAWAEDQGNKGSGTFSVPDPGTITPTSSPQVIVVHVNCSGTPTALTTPSGWTLANNNANSDYVYYMVVTSTAPVHFVSPTSVIQWAAQVDSFK